ncbi:uncharacterized protein PHACADRAFT_247931 [Phanerochaete carnosa HHB-10118-sp]|uniref:EthD domain-containing protein n=1 Tax=Phanerochaete carnosa (strain HHB-10118-sp) TaxID=650164 RepID=K5WQ80_PHACS|nr:uncharacterized protein PHACADRAFT_247931 [Phanerochaete carnosa HHB-10118-sp]EKM61374.1 hypothetical protein PHACADRAFT_247931 [Phanerochaete carnosa HHB-10118-sp]
MAPAAYLLVLSQPGERVSEEEFDDWYDNEHVPLRLDVPAFRTWNRWKAADGQKPAWAASYDIASYEDTLKQPCSRLAETRSEREKRIFSDIEIADRRTYELREGTLPSPSSLYNPKKPARYVAFVFVDVKEGGEELLNGWYDEEHIPMFAKQSGWVRSRRFVLKDWGRVGVDGQKDQQPPAKYLAVHERESTEAVKDPKFIQTWETSLKAEVDKVVVRREVRSFEYYKHWEK